MKFHIAAFTVAAALSISFSNCLGVKISNPADNLTTVVKVDAPFHGIETTGTADIEYIPGDAIKIEISAPEEIMPNITVKVEKGVLKIGQKESTFTNRNIGKYAISARVTAPGIDCFKTYGTGDMKVEYITGKKLKFYTYGTGNINTENVECDEAYFKTYGTGDINIDKLNITTGELETAGTGDIKIKMINATDLKANTSGTGDIDLMGGHIIEGSFKATGTGDIEAKKVSVDKKHVRGSKTGNVNL